MKRVFVILAVATVAHQSFVGAQDSPEEKFEPSPAAEQPLYRFNFPRNFFANPAAEKAARPRIYADLAALEKYKGKLAESPQTLLNGLRQFDTTLSRLMRHAVYLYLQYATNTKNTAAMEDQTKLFADLNTRTSFIQQELMRIEPAKWDAFVKREPALSKYAFSVLSARRLRPHMLARRFVRPNRRARTPGPPRRARAPGPARST